MWEESKIDTPSSQPLHQNVSVMRNFLESGDDFEWPEDLGKCSGNHCDISGDVIPLNWKKCISDTRNASIDRFEAGPKFRFQKPFVVKSIRGMDNQEAWNMTAKEVNNMKDLRHPHVTALLGTFTYQARLNILIFPSACCDLRQLMSKMSERIEKELSASRSGRTSPMTSDTTNPGHPWDSTVGPHKSQEVHAEPWPLIIPIDKQIEMLRGYFVCLSQAISYLHSSGVRHKDIKPENILIDESGSVILTDFGISRRFPKHTPHATNNEWKFTRKYASPEIMKDRNTLRDDPSDVFSLGCVFLEMATLLLGRSLSSFSDHYAPIVNETSKEEAYYCNLGSVHSWIDCLRAPRGLKPVREHSLPGEIGNIQKIYPDSDICMTAALVDLREMLDETPSSRPDSRGLWQRFQHISAIKCRDCDPRRPHDIWQPSAKQQRDAQTGLINRRSLHAINEKNVISRELPVLEDIDSTMLSAQFKPNASPRRKGRASSPSTQRHRHSKDGYFWTRSEPEASMLQANGNTQKYKMRAIRSPSPESGTAQKQGTACEDFTHGSGPASIQTSRAKANHENHLDVGRQSPHNMGANHSRRSVRLDQQSREAPNQSGAIEEDTSTSELNESTSNSQTRVLVYDVSQKIVFEADLAFLRGGCISPQLPGRLA